MLRRLHDDFGASGLAELIAKVPKRIGGLLFALSPVHTQLEMARLLAPEDLSGCARQLLISNRMGRDEASWLFGLLESAKTGAMRPRRNSFRGMKLTLTAASWIVLGVGWVEALPAAGPPRRASTLAPGLRWPRKRAD